MARSRYDMRWRYFSDRNNPVTSTLVYLMYLISYPTHGQVEGRDAMEPLYWRVNESKDASRPRLSHHSRGLWNEWDERKEIMEWNLWQEKTGETPRTTKPERDSSTTKPTLTEKRVAGDESHWAAYCTNIFYNLPIIWTVRVTNMFEIAHYAKPILQELISRVLLEIETRGRVFV